MNKTKQKTKGVIESGLIFQRWLYYLHNSLW